MSDIAISVKNLTKVYHLYDNPKDRLKEALNPFKKSYHHDFYALNDVSFEIKKGETVGIIGKNGAGKSTLLKMITGVLTPTGGSVEVNGKIASLLELGAGFNLEMTGMENVYLNGTIMGFSKEEMDQKVDAILEFADIGAFIDQPVKMYSSGMFARLAFSVAINVEPDVLIVDEALSVGDMAFQYKCFMKMKEIKEQGTTIVLVTHSMSQILDNCDRAILINQGLLIEDTYDIKHVVAEYEKVIRNISLVSEGKEEVSKIEIDIKDFTVQSNKDVEEKRFGTHRAIIKEVFITDTLDGYSDSPSIESGKSVFIRFYILSKEDISDIVLGVSLKKPDSSDIWGDNNLFAQKSLSLKKGLNQITYEFTCNITRGEYLLFCGLATFNADTREELDQRWPIKKVIVQSKREAVGNVYAPISIILS